MLPCASSFHRKQGRQSPANPIPASSAPPCIPTSTASNTSPSGPALSPGQCGQLHPHRYTITHNFKIKIINKTGMLSLKVVYFSMY